MLSVPSIVCARRSTAASRQFRSVLTPARCARDVILSSFRSSTPTPSHVRFHIGTDDGDANEAGGVENDGGAGVPGNGGNGTAVNTNGQMSNGHTAGTNVPPKEVTIDVRDAPTNGVNGSRPSVQLSKSVGLEAGGGVGPSNPLHRARSVSHWHDSRISVEMHLALYIEDLMLLAPGAAGEKTGSATEGGAPSVEGVAHVAAPVAFDEDAEPDITLQHVLAGVEYLLHTRIIGSAGVGAGVGGPGGAGANPAIAEADEDGESDGETDEKKSVEAVVESTATGEDANGMPAPLASAPAAVVDEAVTSSSNSVQFPPSSLASPYFYFVSLDLALCDDLVTALCYHMRRAEKKWSLKPKPTLEATKALELFEGFFTYVYSFRVSHTPTKPP
jgi:hypothetical protein